MANMNVDEETPVLAPAAPAPTIEANSIVSMDEEIPFTFFDPNSFAPHSHDIPVSEDSGSMDDVSPAIYGSFVPDGIGGLATPQEVPPSVFASAASPPSPSPLAFAPGTPVPPTPLGTVIPASPTPGTPLPINSLGIPAPATPMNSIDPFAEFRKMFQSFEATSRASQTQFLDQNAKLVDGMTEISNRLQTFQLDQNEKIKNLNSRLDSLTNRLTDLESGPSHSSGHAAGSFEDGSPSPAKKGRVGSAQHRSQSSPPVVRDSQSTLTNTQEKAKNPCCIRLRGFPFKLPKNDMISLAKQLCEHLQVNANILDYHASAFAGSCVVEFLTEAHARKALEISKVSNTKWKDPVSKLDCDLFFAYDESAEVRAYGHALHLLYDSAAKHIIPHCPSGTHLKTHRKAGLLEVVYQKRVYPIFSITSPDNGESFHFVERRGRWNTMKPPEFVSQAMLAAVRADTAELDLFNN